MCVIWRCGPIFPPESSLPSGPDRVWSDVMNGRSPLAARPPGVLGRDLRHGHATLAWWPGRARGYFPGQYDGPVEPDGRAFPDVLRELSDFYCDAISPRGKRERDGAARDRPDDGVMLGLVRGLVDSNQCLERHLVRAEPSRPLVVIPGGNSNDTGRMGQ